ncbi:hypothetical protein [Chelativorans sp. Marseille-P2723]|uniref:hypothetical protein n=1 Tax=Chelativorans sp. Marseille-P2723 TaxID=2709133 RepID=UPI001FEF3A5F|nr:hypothetical protein [Chelativorans sp. Marseille-P2723]
MDAGKLSRSFVVLGCHSSEVKKRSTALRWRQTHGLKGKVITRLGMARMLAHAPRSAMAMQKSIAVIGSVGE